VRNLAPGLVRGQFAPHSRAMVEAEWKPYAGKRRLKNGTKVRVKNIHLEGAKRTLVGTVHDSGRGVHYVHFGRGLGMMDVHAPGPHEGVGGYITHIREAAIDLRELAAIDHMHHMMHGWDEHTLAVHAARHPNPRFRAAARRELSRRRRFGSSYRMNVKGKVLHEARRLPAHMGSKAKVTRYVNAVNARQRPHRHKGRVIDMKPRYSVVESRRGVPFEAAMHGASKEQAEAMNDRTPAKGSFKILSGQSGRDPVIVHGARDYEHARRLFEDAADQGRTGGRMSHWGGAPATRGDIARAKHYRYPIVGEESAVEAAFAEARHPGAPGEVRLRRHPRGGYIVHHRGRHMGRVVKYSNGWTAMHRSLKAGGRGDPRVGGYVHSHRHRTRRHAIEALISGPMGEARPEAMMRATHPKRGARRVRAREAAAGKPKRKVHYTAQTNPGGGRFYLAGGIGYPSLGHLRKAHPDAELVRVKAKRSNRLFG
jgi:hypothetical protein